MSKSCKSCQFVLNVSHRFDALESLDERDLISYYFSCGFTYRSIVKILDKKHDLSILYSTRKLQLKEYNLKRHGVEYDDEIVHHRIVQLLDGPGCIAGVGILCKKKAFKCPGMLSVANQRIKGWWSFFRKNCSIWWINLFKDLVDTQVLTLGNEMEMECLWYCFFHTHPE